MSSELSHIRNFSIIAHIDHGKSTLADRLLEHTQTVTKREMRDQILDTMDLERERGITIKAQTARMVFPFEGTSYVLNLIDTPGHVDFTYEVSRSLAACQGALLVVDASQGIEAQTISNTYLALEQDLEIIPVVNKIDLPSADSGRVLDELKVDLGLDVSSSVSTSAKEGVGIQTVLERIVSHIPPPKGRVQAPLQALLFDAWFNAYKGVICIIRLFDGVIRKGQVCTYLHSGAEYEILECGYLTPKMTETGELRAGEVGYIICGIKDIRDVKIGDTLSHRVSGHVKPLPGFRTIKPVVFAGIYPVASKDYENLRKALEKLTLNDASLRFEPETSTALGLGFRLGFLGLLHMEIVQERLEREYDLHLITTAPSVVFELLMKDGSIKNIETPSQFPDSTTVEETREPVLHVSLYTPSTYLGNVLSLCEEKRGKQLKMVFMSHSRVLLEYEIPYGEVILDFHDRLKSCSRGFASMDYEPMGFVAADLVKMDILLNGEPVDALSVIVHRSKAFQMGKALCRRLKSVLERGMFEIAIQAAIGKKVVARETLGALRKDVTAKCYGGDISRKRKLLEKQKKGKKRMKRVGKVDIPQEAFLAVLSVGREEK